MDEAPPLIDDVRLPCCPQCGAVAMRDGRVVLHGHGIRMRFVVVPDPMQPRLVRCWVRRFRCTACSATCTVRPPGVIADHLFSLWAILMAWWLATRSPIGEGLEDEAVYARQGVDRLTPERDHGGRPRWRSLARWARRIDDWWPGRVVVGATWRQRVERLLMGLIAAGGDDWLGHAIGGAAM